MQNILGEIFSLILESEKEDVDLKERATYYYKTLTTKP